jgi:hypothetical protein
MQELDEEGAVGNPGGERRSEEISGEMEACEVSSAIVNIEAIGEESRSIVVVNMQDYLC